MQITEVLINIGLPFLTFALGAGKFYIDARKLKIENGKLGKSVKEQELKLNIFDKVMDLNSINKIKLAIDRIFANTSADRFLILIAINGKEDFSKISVIFEQHKSSEYAINATARYKNIFIDAHYKQMLKQAEIEQSKVVHFDVEKMEDCLLKDFYISEGVRFSKVRHLLRKSIDKDNDVLIYSSMATHNSKKFSRTELAFMKAQIEGTIIENLENVLD